MAADVSTHGWLRALVVVTTLVAGLVAAACTPLGSKGTLPPPGRDGEVDASSAPDFLAVAGRDGGIEGYARKEDVLGSGSAPFLVFGDDLRTVVGQMVPGRGFVPVGVDPASVPTFPVEVGPSGSPNGEAAAQVVLYVRNDASQQAWVTVLIGGQPWDTTGFWGENSGAGCYAMPAGSRLVLMDRSPKEPGARVVRSIYVRGHEAEPPASWITIGKDGAVRQGAGVPEWWGAAQAC